MRKDLYPSGGLKVRSRLAVTAGEPSPPRFLPPQIRDNPPQLPDFVSALAEFSKTLVKYLIPQEPERNSNEPPPSHMIGRPLQPGPLDEITDENGKVEVPKIKAGEKTIMWRYQLPPSDPRYRPLGGRYELGKHFTE